MQKCKKPNISRRIDALVRVINQKFYPTFPSPPPPIPIPPPDSSNAAILTKLPQDKWHKYESLCSDPKNNTKQNDDRKDKRFEITSASHCPK